MEKIIRFLDKYIWIVVAVLLVPACWALFVPGYYGASDDIHIAWLYEFHRVLMMGQIPPRFVPDLSYTFGYPLFNFVFPLPFIISEIFHLIGFNLVDSIKALFLVSIPLSFIFMFLFLRQFSSRFLALAGALLYVYSPYRATDLYVRGAIGEIVSFIFLPAILLSLTGIYQSKNLKWIAIGGLALSALVMSHNITAYMFFPSFLLLSIFLLIISKNKLRFTISFISMVLLGLLISIYFWLPAVVESGLMKYDTVFNFSDHYPTLRQLFKPYWGYGASVAGPYDGMSFFLGIVNVLVLIAAPFLTYRFWPKLNKETKVLLLWAFLVIASSIFLMNYRSQFVWDNLPLLPYFQFPWRFLILPTLTIPILIIIFENIKFKLPLVALLISLTLLTSSSYFRPHDFLGRTDEYFLNRYIPNPVASKEYKETREEYLRLSKDTRIRPDQVFPLVSTSPSAKLAVTKINDLETIINISSTQSAVLNYNKYYFPGWTATIDNVKTEIKVGQPFGQINVSVPAGDHIVRLSFKETSFRFILDAISLVAFLVSLGMCLKKLKQDGP